MANYRWVLCFAFVWLAGSAAVHADDPCDRSSYQGKVAWYALPTFTRAYTGYYVGGSRAFGGSGRCPEDGTWGIDYRGLLLPSRVNLWWNYGERHERSGGTYKADGHPVPDVPALLNPSLYGKKPEQ